MPSARRVVYAYDDVFLRHDFPGHPESPARLRAITRELARAGLDDRLIPLPFTPASDQQLARVHDRRYLAWLASTANGPAGYVTPDTYIAPGSHAAATSAAGATIECLRAVLDGRAEPALALVRPPGHHARPAQPMGFCLLNNIACAASEAIEVAGLERVLIFDFDIHHGNGTQEAFYDDPRVYYVSIHQRPPLFPGSGTVEERGRGAGYGYTANVPLPPGAGDASYQACLEQIVVPLAESYRPQAILVSAGYDCHWREEVYLADMRLSLGGGFDSVTQRLVELANRLCQGRIVFVLEGGYDLEVLSAGVANLARILLGAPEECDDPFGPSPRPSQDDLDYIRSLRHRFGVY